MDLTVVLRAVCQCLLEDRGIGGDPDDVAVAHQSGQSATAEPFAVQAGHPDGYAVIRESGQSVEAGHDASPHRRAGRRDSGTACVSKPGGTVGASTHASGGSAMSEAMVSNE